MFKHPLNTATVTTILLLSSLLLTACSSNDDDDVDVGGSFLELSDPFPGNGDNFGEQVIVLPNGNIVVTDPGDSSITTKNGAVHLYNAETQTLIASIYGDNANDQIGLSGITALANSNFIIASPFDDIAGVVDAGSVKLVNGSNGVQISQLAGNNEDDLIGIGSALHTGITALANNNYVISSPNEDIVISGTPTENVGSVRLMHGSTGDQIKIITGTTAFQFFSEHVAAQGITALANSNFIIVAGAEGVQLRNGNNGELIGTPIKSSSTVFDPAFFGNGGITVLANNNYVIASPLEDVSSITDAGSVQLVNGTTGAKIGSAITGNNANDRIGRGPTSNARGRGTTALANSNFAIISPHDDIGGIIDAGSVQLVNGTTGAKIGSAIEGSIKDDNIGDGGVTALANNNFIAVSPIHDVLISGITNIDAGSAQLINGNDGTKIGQVAGDAGERIGDGGVTALVNNNFVIVSYQEGAGGIDGKGLAQLANGSTGEKIGEAIAGDNQGDFLVSSATALTNNNYIFVAPFDDVNSIVDAGSIRQINGDTGIQVGEPVTGNAQRDMALAKIITPSNGEIFYIIAAPGADNNNIVDSGFVRLITP